MVPVLGNNFEEQSNIYSNPILVGYLSSKLIRGVSLNIDFPKTSNKGREKGWNQVQNY